MRSANFHVVGDAGEAELRKAAARLEEFRAVFARLFPGMKLGSPVPTRIFVFNDQQTFERFKPVTPAGDSATWIRGYYQAGDDGNSIALARGRDDADTFRIIFHEYSHFLIENNLGRSNVAPWLNEGLAEYFETIVFNPDRTFTIGTAAPENLGLLKSNKPVPFETLASTDYRTLHSQTKETASNFYANAWLAVHYLNQGDNAVRRAQNAAFLKLIGEGWETREALREAFKATPAELGEELASYLARGRFTASTADLGEVPSVAGAARAEAVSDVDALAYQGELLYRISRLSDAEKILVEALAISERSGAANTTLGLVKMRQKDFYSAKQYLEKAVKFDEANYLAYFSYAYVLSREEMSELGFISGYTAAEAERIRANLRRAIDLNPGFAESYSLWAFVSGIRNENLPEAFEMIEKALAIAPGNQWYQIRKAELLMRKEDFAAARMIAARVVTTAPDDHLKVYAVNTLNNINSLEAQLLAIRNRRKMPTSDLITDEPVSEEELGRRRQKALIESTNAALRRPFPDERRVLGNITRVECRAGEYYVEARAADEVLRLHRDSLEGLTLISFEVGTVATSFGCNSTRPLGLSVITYRPPRSGRSKQTGELIAVEFVPEYFKLQ